MENQNFEELEKCKNDIFYFMSNYVKINHPTRGLIAFEFEDFQIRCLREILDNKYSIVLKCRDASIDTIAASYCAWRFLFLENQYDMIVCRSVASAKAMMNLVKSILWHLPDFILSKFDFNNNSEIKNSATKSRLLCWSYQACRGRSLNFLYVQDAAYISNMDMAWPCIFPCLQQDSKVLVASTPKPGKVNWFRQTYEAAEKGENAFHPMKIDYRDISWYTKEHIDNLKNSLSANAYKLEVLAEFT